MPKDDRECGLESTEQEGDRDEAWVEDSQAVALTHGDHRPGTGRWSKVAGYRGRRGLHRQSVLSSGSLLTEEHSGSEEHADRDCDQCERAAAPIRRSDRCLRGVSPRQGRDRGNTGSCRRRGSGSSGWNGAWSSGRNCRWNGRRNRSGDGDGIHAVDVRGADDQAAAASAGAVALVDRDVESVGLGARRGAGQLDQRSAVRGSVALRDRGTGGRRRKWIAADCEAVT